MGMTCFVVPLPGALVFKSNTTQQTQLEWNVHRFSTNLLLHNALVVHK